METPTMAGNIWPHHTCVRLQEGMSDQEVQHHHCRVGLEVFWGDQLLDLKLKGEVTVERTRWPWVPGSATLTNSDLLDGQQVELLNLSVTNLWLEISRKLQVVDELDLREDALVIKVGVTARRVRSLTSWAPLELLTASLPELRLCPSSPDGAHWTSPLSDGSRDARLFLALFHQSLFDTHVGSQTTSRLPFKPTNTTRPFNVTIWTSDMTLQPDSGWTTLSGSIFHSLYAPHHVVQQPRVRLLGGGAPCQPHADLTVPPYSVTV